MKHRILTPALVLFLSLGALHAPASPAAAQEASAADAGWWEWGMSWFGDSIAQELAPALGDVRALAEQFGPAVAPALERLMALVDDMTFYELPEMLENGDIIIRRKPDAPQAEAPANGAADL